MNIPQGTGSKSSKFRLHRPQLIPQAIFHQDFFRDSPSPDPDDPRFPVGEEMVVVSTHIR